ncbi:MAG: D-glucuronyl C5-epimerase family protein [Candidatus Eisenbacteria bacterium]
MAGEKLGRHIDLSSPRGYYLDYSHLAGSGTECDDKGVPVVRVRGGGKVCSPPLIARAALGQLEHYLESGNTERRERFRCLSRWLVDGMEVLPGSFGGWSMPEVPRALRRELPQGWFSASAHAECVAVLVRAASLLRQDGALETARRAVGAFHCSVEDGGFLREIGEAGAEGSVESLAFIEEFPVAGAPRMVLSSHVKAMWALFDYLNVDEDPGVRALFNRCVGGLIFALDRFDLGYWTCAHLDGRRIRPADFERHGTHVLMMDVLHQMTGNETFEASARRWRGYAQGSRNRARARFERARTALANTGAPVAPE